MNELEYDPDIGFGCTKCPTELAKGEHEDDFDDIEIHISDGVDMGCQDNITKGRISDDIFKIERAGDELVKGTDCFERSVLPTKAMRKSLKDGVESDFNKASVKAAITEIGSNQENPRCVAIKGLLKKFARIFSLSWPKTLRFQSGFHALRRKVLHH